MTSGLDSVRLVFGVGFDRQFSQCGVESRRAQPDAGRDLSSRSPENKIKLLAADRTRELAMPETIRIVRIHPEIPGPSKTTEHGASCCIPDGAIPRFGVEISSPKGTRRDRACRSDHRCSAGGDVESSRRSASSRGFTLLEVLVATVILAVAIAGLMSALSGSLRVAARAHRLRPRGDAGPPQDGRNHRGEATAPQRDVLKARTIPTQTNGSPSGWRARIAPFRSSSQSTSGNPIVDRIEVQVWWMNGAGRAHV